MLQLTVQLMETYITSLYPPHTKVIWLNTIETAYIMVDERTTPRRYSQSRLHSTQVFIITKFM